ncbi:Glyoxylase, beta-lactamase superfamily II [Polaromonas sp. YR568]|uniref:MBL fold metallo-hydrolase n=1 Tax=Polaromonas sp. YR568 TaxID=1855301 RepID=UPI0008F25B0C|nr:MBL fold metallo-hydrolase [Polaromonas sp. YR568]SFU99785.1 Glyoxylase, beta-lactamase superfamily II [Polaromonas sp. YR568]
MSAPVLPAGLHAFERGWLSANNILFTDGEETVLVDSGYCTHSVQTLALIESVLGSRPLDVLVNTHLHSDHCGGNAALQARYPDLQTLIPPGHAQQVAEWDPVALTYLPTGQLCPQFGFTQVIEPGHLIRFGSATWQAHAAPGHDPNSLIFFEPQDKLLISADALWENGFGVVFPELEGTDAFAEVAATLDLIEHLEPKTVIPGHGRVFAYTPDILVRARQRLESFASNPRRHARHAAKVLLKFKLLETQRQDFDEFAQWAISTPYFTQIKAKFFADCPVRAWIEELSAELITAGVAKRDGAYILNA